MLRERVPIRDGVGISKRWRDGATTKNPVLLTEYVRQSVRRSIVKQVMNNQGEVLLTCDPSLERAIESSVEHGENNSIMSMAPDGIRIFSAGWAANREGRSRSADYKLRRALLSSPDR